MTHQGQNNLENGKMLVGFKFRILYFVTEIKQIKKTSVLL
jgi:hypothetical protein